MFLKWQHLNCHEISELFRVGGCALAIEIIYFMMDSRDDHSEAVAGYLLLSLGALYQFKSSDTFWLESYSCRIKVKAMF